MPNRKQTEYNKLIGRIGERYYFLGYTFQRSPDFKGVTGSVLEPLTEEEYGERWDNYFDTDNMRELWRQAVEANETEQGLDDWIKFVKDTDRGEAVIDRSYSTEYSEQLRELLGEEATFEVDCVGGGRCFDKEMTWDELFNKELWAIIQKFES